MTNSSSYIYSLPNCDSDSTSKVGMWNKVLHLNRKTQCGSSTPTCQANVIQALNGAQVATGKREIPHCITALLSKLYYLGHGLLCGCQSYHTKHRSNSPYLALPAPTHKHRETQKKKAQYCEYNQQNNKQWAVINYRLMYHCILFQTGELSAEQLLSASLGL